MASDKDMARDNRQETFDIRAFRQLALPEKLATYLCCHWKRLPVNCLIHLFALDSCEVEDEVDRDR